MHALVCQGNGVVEYKSVTKPEVGSNEALVKVVASGVCGSDLPRVRAYAGRWEGLILGHELSGVVEEVCQNGGSASQERFTRGDRVVVVPLSPCFSCTYCLQGKYALCTRYTFIGSRQDGGFAEYVTVPVQNLFLIPDSLDFEVACFVEPLAVAIHAVNQIKRQPGASVLITGAGTIGLLLVQVIRSYGAGKIWLSEISPLKRQLALQLGADVVTDPSQVLEQSNSNDPKHQVDIAFECSGNPGAVQDAVGLLACSGQVVLVGTPPNESVWPWTIPESITRKELVVSGSWMSYSQPFPGSEWVEAIRLLATGLIRTQPMVTHSGSLEEGPDLFRMMLSGTEPYCKVVFRVR
jgi:L-iditol 2-dehydrogenase